MTGDDRARSLGGEAFGDERCVRRRIRDIRRRRASFFLDLGEQPTLKCSGRALLLRMIVGECRRKIEMTPGAQSRDDTPVDGGDDERDTAP
jgi:hypothetical protein